MTLTLVSTTPVCGACSYDKPGDMSAHCDSPTCRWFTCPNCGAACDHDGRFIPKEDRRLAAEAA